MELSPLDRERIRELEESLWIPDTRFDRAYMDRVLAPDFVEFGRSGRVYSRQVAIDVQRMGIPARLPLPHFEVRGVAPGVALATYRSDVAYPTGRELANRASLWLHADGRWQLRFHQGTAIPSEPSP